MFGKPLTCPYCGRIVTAPLQDGLVMVCHESGGECPQTVYMQVMIEAGNMPSQNTAFNILYEELTGHAWPGWEESDQPHFELNQGSFLTGDGTLVDDPPDEETLLGVMFMRLLEDEKELLYV